MNKLKKMNQNQQGNRQTLGFGKDKYLFLPNEENEKIIDYLWIFGIFLPNFGAFK